MSKIILKLTKHSLLFLIISFPFKGFTQQYYEFLGAIIYQNKPISYKIAFTEKNKIITGYSITDINGENETKTQIKGKLENDKFSFKETKLLYSKTKQPLETLCYLTTKGKIIRNENKVLLRGTYKGYYAKEVTVCARGSFFLMSAKDIYEQLTHLNQKLQSETSNDTLNKVLKETISPLNNVKSIVALKTGEVARYTWKSQWLKIAVWDDGAQDGDIISIKANGKYILKNHSVEKAKKTIQIPFNGNPVTLEIEAVNEGQSPPNTAKILLIDSEKEYALFTEGKKGKFITIFILPEQK